MADNDLGSFERRIRNVAVKVEAGVERTIRKCALAIDQAIVMATPVDTGRARANWIVSISSPTGRINPASPEGEAGSSGAANAQAALNQAAEAIGKYKLSDGSIFIQNNLPYIKRLNEGWSAQAPEGLVERGVQAGVNAIKSARIFEEDGS